MPNRLRARHRANKLQQKSLELFGPPDLYLADRQQTANAAAHFPLRGWIELIASGRIPGELVPIYVPKYSLDCLTVRLVVTGSMAQGCGYDIWAARQTTGGTDYCVYTCTRNR